MDYVRYVAEEYAKPITALGVLGPILASELNDYCYKYNMDYNTQWKVLLSEKNMLKRIEQMLEEDIPVILSIGVNQIPFNKGVNFCTKCEKGDFQYDNTKNKLYQYIIEDGEYDINIDSHYVTIIGVIKDTVSDTIMLRISSWGSEYYIDYEEYRNFVDKYSDAFTSSIVYITE